MRSLTQRYVRTAATRMWGAPDSCVASSAADKSAERAEAIERLRGWVKPGDKIHCILHHRAASGMSRVIQLVKIDGEQMVYLGRSAAAAMGNRYDDGREGIVVSGVGMDMGFYVYNLGATLWPEGYRCPGRNCRSSDHSNNPYPVRDGRRKHRDGGYALQSVWL